MTISANNTIEVELSNGKKGSVYFSTRTNLWNFETTDGKYSTEYDSNFTTASQCLAHVEQYDQSL